MTCVLFVIKACKQNAIPPVVHAIRVCIPSVSKYGLNTRRKIRLMLLVPCVGHHSNIRWPLSFRIWSDGIRRKRLILVRIAEPARLKILLALFINVLCVRGLSCVDYVSTGCSIMFTISSCIETYQRNNGHLWSVNRNHPPRNSKLCLSIPKISNTNISQWISFQRANNIV